MSSRTRVLVFCGLLASAALLGAQVVVSPTAVVGNTLGEFNASWPIGRVIDGQDLSTAFTSGETLLDDLLDLDPVGTTYNRSWFSQNGVTTGTIDFDLGTEIWLDQVVLWSAPGVAPSIGSFAVWAANSIDFVGGTQLGTFTLLNGATETSAQVFDVLDRSARYVRLEVLSSTATYSSLHEFAVVTGSPIPEPGAVAWLAGAAALGLGLWRRRARPSVWTETMGRVFGRR